MRLRKKSPERVDRELLLLATRGDVKAFEALFDRYAAAAYALAVRICGDRVLAEDVVQETFLSVWRRPGSYSPARGTVAAYILGTLHHKAVDAVRHEQAIRRRVDHLAERGLEPGPPELVEEAWLSVRRDQVRAAVNQLSEVQREAMELAYFEGLTYSEVAEKLGIPLGTAKTRLRDGIIRLRSLLSDSGISD